MSLELIIFLDVDIAQKILHTNEEEREEKSIWNSLVVYVPRALDDMMMMALLVRKKWRNVTPWTIPSAAASEDLVM